jgi:hypothetical protein
MPLPLVPPLMPLPLVPPWLEPLLEVLCFLLCFFLLLLWVVEAPLLWSPMVPVAPLWLPDVLLAPVPLWSVLLPDCAWTGSELNIAATTEAPSKPFNTLFIFMSIS